MQNPPTPSYDTSKTPEENLARAIFALCGEVRLNHRATQKLAIETETLRHAINAQSTKKP